MPIGTAAHLWSLANKRDIESHRKRPLGCKAGMTFSIEVSCCTRSQMQLANIFCDYPRWTRNRPVRLGVLVTRPERSNERPLRGR